ncbi:hypothetical protein PR202_gn00495 [Eleusine coracana subsp. coracana]|uniref:DUF6598 domain-containing protein n=1 Tax=Eleusine coracana subsp. coracana TaxID=191504 RepID=A0AAV5G3N8_ELECO|nr:hypothetical protein PR202_gn00495 [Eleusine coracana subsp. coracana]
MGTTEVDKAKVVFPSLLEPKTLVKDDLENKGQVIVEGKWDFLCTDKEDEEWAAWQENFVETAETKVVPEPKRTESMEEREARREERRKVNLEKFGSDYQALLASQFRRHWDFWTRYQLISILLQLCAARIPPMRYTDKPAPEYTATALDTLQIFSAKVAEIKGGLQWPLDVFDLVAIRDPIDQNCYIIFYRTRDNCQTLTEKVDIIS